LDHSGASSSAAKTSTVFSLAFDLTGYLFFELTHFFSAENEKRSSTLPFANDPTTEKDDCTLNAVAQVMTKPPCEFSPLSALSVRLRSRALAGPFCLARRKRQHKWRSRLASLLSFFALEEEEGYFRGLPSPSSLAASSSRARAHSLIIRKAEAAVGVAQVQREDEVLAAVVSRRPGDGV